MVSQGLAEVAYLYGDYAYTDELKQAQKEAQAKGMNIWSEKSGEATPAYVYIVSAIGILVIIFLSVSNIKGKKSKIRKVKRVIKKIQK